MGSPFVFTEHQQPAAPIEGLSSQPSKVAGGTALFYEGKEFAHFHHDNEIDLPARDCKSTTEIQYPLTRTSAELLLRQKGAGQNANVRQHLDMLAPGHYWKTPFIWEPGCPEPPAVSALRYEPVCEPWLHRSIAAVMTHSLDESDKFTVDKIGINKAVDEVYEISAKYFEQRAGWWQAATDVSGRKVGFVLTTVFAEPSRWKDSKPQGTILYMGVLPGFLGHGYSLELILQATRTCIDASCWRVFCDTGSDNFPMINAFRKAGYMERRQWQRPLA